MFFDKITWFILFSLLYSAEKLIYSLKIKGTSSIVDEVTHEPILSILTLIVETTAKLLRDGHRVIIVSSGAVGVGLRRMDVDTRPTHLPRIQVRIAAVYTNTLNEPHIVNMANFESRLWRQLGNADS